MKWAELKLAPRNADFILKSTEETKFSHLIMEIGVKPLSIKYFKEK